jgi:hypothetical protein
MVNNKWLINMPEEPQALDADGALVEQLRADLANASDRITFLEGHISQLTNALSAAPEPKPRPWFIFWK